MTNVVQSVYCKLNRIKLFSKFTSRELTRYSLFAPLKTAIHTV